MNLNFAKAKFDFLTFERFLNIYHWNEEVAQSLESVDRKANKAVVVNLWHCHICICQVLFLFWSQTCRGHAPGKFSTLTNTAPEAEGTARFIISRLLPPLQLHSTSLHLWAGRSSCFFVLFCCFFNRAAPLPQMPYVCGGSKTLAGIPVSVITLEEPRAAEVKVKLQIMMNTTEMGSTPGRKVFFFVFSAELQYLICSFFPPVT